MIPVIWMERFWSLQWFSTACLEKSQTSYSSERWGLPCWILSFPFQLHHWVPYTPWFIHAIPFSLGVAHPGLLLCLFWLSIASSPFLRNEFLPSVKRVPVLSELKNVPALPPSSTLKGFLPLKAPMAFFLYLTMSRMFFLSLPALSPPVHSKVLALSRVSSCWVSISLLRYTLPLEHLSWSMMP